MRVVFVIPYFYPAWEYGGSPRAAFEYAKALVARGHRVTVLTTDSMGSSRCEPVDEAKPVEVDGILVHYYRNLSNELAFRQRLFWPKGFFRNLQNRLTGADILHIHELRSFLSVAACSVARSIALPYVLSPHGGLRRIGKEFPKRIYDTLWGHKILDHSSSVIVLSESEGKDAQEFGVPTNRIFMMPNSAPSDLLRTRPAFGNFRTKWNLGDRRLVAFLGRLHPIKGTDLLMRAFAKLATSMSDVRLVIAGPDDGQEMELRRIAEKEGCAAKVTFTGFLDSNAKTELLVDADILVIPSRRESFPVTLLEALSIGSPVLLSSSCDLSRVFHPEHGVDSFQSENVDSLLDKLRGILSSNELKDHVENGAAMVRRDYSSDKVGNALEGLYSSVLHREITA